ncbi:Non-specific serine/threonine protein kinase [Bertholletia excelsa]
MERFPNYYSSENIQNDDIKFRDFPSIKLELIRKATNHFSGENKLGESEFGPVYKGTLPNGKEIAVKRLSRSYGLGLQEFKNEVTLIARLQLRNLVRLLVGGTNLNWKTWLSIINGIAHGILYLHEDSWVRIIHRDLKVSNVLLDHEMNSKISDFGMVRIFGGNQSEANTSRVYAMERLFFVKLDIFSFEVLLLEIISGKKNNGFYLSKHECKESELIDPSLEQLCVAIEALKCIHIVLLCVEQDPIDRPAMSFVVVMLATEGMILPQPKQPPFFVGRLVLTST